MLKNYEKYTVEAAATCLLLNIANSDEKLELSEISSIKEIILDFFNLKIENLELFFEDCKVDVQESTDLYKYSKILNDNLNYEDKVNFICCTFEVAYTDNELHFLEEHFIKKIATTLNVNHRDLITSKKEIQSYL
tara:strand:- start:1473 stop:1877 length:405 start_codon:yes stop_codon:yes gene_type:complete